MPMYEYHCPVCGHEFEVLQRMGEGNEKVKCPNCDTPRPQKKFSTFAAGGIRTMPVGTSTPTCGGGG